MGNICMHGPGENYQSSGENGEPWLFSTPSPKGKWGGGSPRGFSPRGKNLFNDMDYDDGGVYVEGSNITGSILRIITEKGKPEAIKLW